MWYKLKRIMMRPWGVEKQVRPVVPPIPYLCFTAEEASSTITLSKTWTPPEVTLETSTDWTTWTDYTIWNTITLANIWDKAYWRNKSESGTQFSAATWRYYYFTMTWKIWASWDLTYLVNKNGTNTLPDCCFFSLFENCTSLTKSPKLPATTIWQRVYANLFYWCTSLETAPELPATTLGGTHCYYSMFEWCSNLTQIPKLPVTTLTNYCYYYMFRYCTKIKLSTTQTWEYQTEYKIPRTWTWTTASYALNYMFQGTWWSWAWTPTINTTYYLHKDNTIVW